MFNLTKFANKMTMALVNGLRRARAGPNEQCAATRTVKIGALVTRGRCLKAEGHEGEHQWPK